MDDTMTLLSLVIIGLATWRISSLFVQEDGPFMLFLRIREKYGISEIAPKQFKIPDTFMGNALSCVWCFSVWASALLYLCWATFPDMANVIFTVLAISAVAIIVDKITTE